MSDTAKDKARKERERQRAQERRDRKRQWEDTKRMYKYQWRHEKEQWTKEKKYAQEQAKKEREWQQKMADTAHQREMADLKKAGLNPVLTATGGSGASSPQGASADVSSLTDNIGQIFATASDYAQSAAQIAQANREAARANAQAAKANRTSARAVYRRAKKTPSNPSNPSNSSDPSDPTQNTGNDNPESNQQAPQSTDTGTGNHGLDGSPLLDIFETSTDDDDYVYQTADVLYEKAKKVHISLVNGQFVVGGEFSLADVFDIAAAAQDDLNHNPQARAFGEKVVSDLVEGAEYLSESSARHKQILADRQIKKLEHMFENNEQGRDALLDWALKNPKVYSFNPNLNDEIKRREVKRRTRGMR